MYIADYYKKKLLEQNNLIKSYESNPFGSHGRFDLNIDKDNEYLVNSHYFRSKEFKKNDSIDILFSGCSISYGTGIPEDAIWGSLISKNKSYVNMSVPGVGAEYNIKQIYKYINIYGKPKQIFCLFAGFDRISTINDGLYFNHNRHSQHSLAPTNKSVRLLPQEDQVHLSTLDRNGKIIDPQKILKSPIDIESFTSPHQGIFRNIWPIYYFQQFCKFAEIDFIWSTWDKTSNDIMEECFTQSGFILDKNNYISINFNVLNTNFNVLCEDSHNSKHYNSKCWNIGTDTGNHPGAHWHQHIADMFINRIK